ncbi:MAG: hypothetical protein ABGX00_11880 [Allomuricauda sp.]
MQKSIFIFLSCFFTISCANRKTEITQIKVFYLPQGTTTDIPIQCNQLYPSLFEEDLMKKVISSQITQDQIGNRLNQLSDSDEDIDMDVRMRIMISYKNRSNDTLCLGEYFGTVLNGKPKNDDRELRDLIKGLIY